MNKAKLIRNVAHKLKFVELRMNLKEIVVKNKGWDKMFRSVYFKAIISTDMYVDYMQFVQ